ncbi:MAG: hypothetical protein IQL11_09870 [Bacteroidales bacterium]|nr:hypothetical protein [Bacteroidales bacterium]
MKKTRTAGIILILLIVLVTSGNVKGQEIPEVLFKSSLTDQMNYLQDRTRIYENYRAIREDMFQLIKKNTLDTLSSAKNQIAGLRNTRNRLNITIDSLNTALDTTKLQLSEMTITKDSIKVLGIELNKVTYNSIMWILVAGLITLLVFGFLAFKRNIAVTASTKKELKDLKDEFEAYRKSSREAREKMSMEHFNELKRLRGG